MVPYQLNHSEDSSSCYFDDIKIVRKRIIAFAEESGNHYIDNYCKYVNETFRQDKLSRNEYIFDIILTGVLLRKYMNVAGATSLWIIGVLDFLWYIRRSCRSLKPKADYLRAKIFSRLPLEFDTDNNINTVSVHKFNKVCWWLNATGEFCEEAVRCTKWIKFLQKLPPQKMSEYQNFMGEIVKRFEELSCENLNVYTKYTESYCNNFLDDRSIREDRLFCSRSPELYHLNMLGAEIMNEGLRDRFRSKKKKVVLLSGCMRPENGSRCKAALRDKDLVCQRCNSICQIGQVAELTKERGCRTIVILHSSSFSSTIVRWAEEKDTGIVVSACLLNLLAGGYEMQRSGISAQCIPLEFAGCKRHWHPEGIPTTVNIDKMVEILDHSDNHK